VIFVAGWMGWMVRVLSYYYSLEVIREYIFISRNKFRVLLLLSP